MKKENNKIFQTTEERCVGVFEETAAIVKERGLAPPSLNACASSEQIRLVDTVSRRFRSKKIMSGGKSLLRDKGLYFY